MDCKDFSLLINALVDNELEGEEKEKVLAHIEACENCKNEYISLSELKNSLKSIMEKENSSLADSVVAQIRNEGSKGKKTPFIFRHIGLASSLVFIAAIALYGGIQRNVSDMNISEEKASVTDASGVVADIENSAPLKTNTYFVPSSSANNQIKIDSNGFDYVIIDEGGIIVEEALPEKATSEKPAVEIIDVSNVMRIECDAEKALPLLSDFEVVEYSENYIVIIPKNTQEVIKIAEILASIDE